MEAIKYGKEVMRLLLAIYSLMQQIKEEKKLSSVTARNLFLVENAALMRDVSTSQLKQNAWTAGQVVSCLALPW